MNNTRRCVSLSYVISAYHRENVIYVMKFMFFSPGNSEANASELLNKSHLVRRNYYYPGKQFTGLRSSSSRAANKLKLVSTDTEQL